MNKVEYNELYAFHPGYYINDIINDMEITQKEFAKRIGTTPKTICKLVNGEINLSKDIALNLSIMFGSSPDVWLNLQKEYEEKIIEIKKQEKLERQKEIIKQLDYNFFVKIGAVENTKNIYDKINQLCSYFKISDLNILSERDFLANFRTGISKVQEKNIICANAWLQTAINIAQNENIVQYNENALLNSIDKIRGMTIQKPEEFMPVLREVFRQCGVIFVLLPQLKNSGINGVVKWLNSEKVILAINDRRHYADTFWFALFHEIKHVLQKNTKTTLISFYKENKEEYEKLEEEANQFARDILIPANKYSDFVRKGNFNVYSIKYFANKININIGIVIGRLQNDGYINNNSQLNKLKDKYEII